MKDQQFLIWIHDRLIHVYRENRNVDFICKLRGIIQQIPKTQETPNLGYSETYIDDLRMKEPNEENKSI